MWKLRSPNDLDARISRGGAHKLQLDQGFLLPSRAFSPGEEVLGFCRGGYFMKRTIIVNNFLHLQLVMKYILLNQHAILVEVHASEEVVDAHMC